MKNETGSKDKKKKNKKKAKVEGEHVKEGSVELRHLASKNQVVDILTKPISKESFDRGKKLIGMKY